MGGSGGYFFFPFREIQKFRFPHKGARVNVHASMHTWFVARGNKDTELKKVSICNILFYSPVFLSSDLFTLKYRNKLNGFV